MANFFNKKFLKTFTMLMCTRQDFSAVEILFFIRTLWEVRNYLLFIYSTNNVITIFMKIDNVIFTWEAWILWAQYQRNKLSEKWNYSPCFSCDRR